MSKSQNTILLADGDSARSKERRGVLGTFYHIIPSSSAGQTFESLKNNAPDVILLADGPEINGFEVVRQLRADGDFGTIPIILLTAAGDADSKLASYGLDVDFLLEPFTAPTLLRCIKRALLIAKSEKDLLKLTREYESKLSNLQDEIDKKTAEIRRLQNAVMETVVDLVEFRDFNTGGHIMRTCLYLKTLVDEMIENDVYTDILSQWNMEFFLASAQLHDVGKIAIADHILNKPGRLTSEEFETMKTHVAEGVAAVRKIQGNTFNNEFLLHAIYLAGTHHERWDGSGYPAGLRGNTIPLEGRLMAIVDVYDALISDRPYKKAVTHESACKVIEEGSGTHFDPTLVGVFLNVESKFREITREL